MKTRKPKIIGLEAASKVWKQKSKEIQAHEREAKLPAGIVDGIGKIISFSYDPHGGKNKRTPTVRMTARCILPEEVETPAGVVRTAGLPIYRVWSLPEKPVDKQGKPRRKYDRELRDFTNEPLTQADLVVEMLSEIETILPEDRRGMFSGLSVEEAISELLNLSGEGLLFRFSSVQQKGTNYVNVYLNRPETLEALNSEGDESPEEVEGGSEDLDEEDESSDDESSDEEEPFDEEEPSDEEESPDEDESDADILEVGSKVIFRPNPETRLKATIIDINEEEETVTLKTDKSGKTPSKTYKNVSVDKLEAWED